MGADAFLICRNPVGAHWQLGPLPPQYGRLVLLGWKVARPPTDGGLPQLVTATLAEALTRATLLTFPCSQCGPGAAARPNSESERVTVVLARKRSMLGSLRSALGSDPSKIVLFSTREADHAQWLFDDAAYPWPLQGQFALLSAPEEEPPRLDQAYESLVRVIEPEWVTVLPALMQTGVDGIVRPGVDGDVIGLLSVSKEFEGRLLGTVESEARAAGMEWIDLPERDFMKAL